MRKVTKIAAGAIMAVAGTAATIVPVSARADVTHEAVVADSTMCHSGHVCMAYPGNGRIIKTWYKYGCYPIPIPSPGEYDRLFENAQTGGAIARVYNKKGCPGSAKYWTIEPGATKDITVGTGFSIALIE